MGSTPQSIQSLLHAAPADIAALLGRARFLAQIRTALLAALPAAAAPHVRIAAYEDHRLTLHVSHAGWATRLYYMQPHLIRAVAQQLRLHVETIAIKVRQSPHTPPAPGGPRPISASNRQHIERVAAWVSDPSLAGALARLARSGNPPHGN